VKPFSAVALLAACWSGCAAPKALDEAYFLEQGSVGSVRHPGLGSLVRKVGARSADESTQRTLADLLQGRKLEPPIENDGSPACEATVVKFRGETFVFVALAPWGASVPGPSWIRLILFDASGHLLDHVYGEVREGRLDMEMAAMPEGRLACKIAAHAGTRAQLQQGSKRFTLAARRDPDNPAPSASGVVCQVGIRNRKLKLLHPDLSE
jgi:hypothetical protein